MKKQSKLSLVDGKFTPDEALEVLMNLFSSKINFHELKNFSSQERFGHPDVHSQKRLPQLKESKKLITAMMREIGNSSEEISIQSEVIITINKKKTKLNLQGKLSQG
jgi:dihydroorotase